MKAIRWLGLLAGAGLLAACGVLAPAGGSLVTEEFMIAGPDPGVQLYVRNKRPRDLKEFGARNIVLFVHGATYPSESAFDLQLDGLSWMDYIAARGNDVYLMDIRGYGKSSRPPEMDQPPERNPPIVRTDTAARDVGAAVDFVLRRRGAQKLNLIGWSWGTTVTAVYTVGHNDKVNHLVLYAPQWIRTAEDVRRRSNRPLGAYRIVKPEAALKGRNAGVPAGKSVMSDAWANEWARATFATDPVGAKADPPYLRAPNGVILDGREYWSAGKALYDPAGIRVPTLVVRGEWDAASTAAMASGVFERLVNAQPREQVTIPEAAHGALFQKNRMLLFEAVQRFLDHQ